MDGVGLATVRIAAELGRKTGVDDGGYVLFDS